MGREIFFYKVNLNKVKDSFSSENKLFKSNFHDWCKSHNDQRTWSTDYFLHFQEIFDKICNDPTALNPQEISSLYYFTYNYHSDYNQNRNFDEKIMEKYGFEYLYCFGGRKTAEAFIQEFWNHFDPVEKRKYLSPDYLITKAEFLDYLNWLCVLTATFYFYEVKEDIAKDYLEDNSEYKDKALLRYNYEIGLRKCIESEKDFDIFYEKNKYILDIIGHCSVFSNYFEIYVWFENLVDLRLKMINKDFENSIIYISDSH